MNKLLLLIFNKNLLFFIKRVKTIKKNVRGLVKGDGTINTSRIDFYSFDLVKIPKKLRYLRNPVKNV